MKGSVDGILAIHPENSKVTKNECSPEGNGDEQVRVNSNGKSKINNNSTNAVTKWILKSRSTLTKRLSCDSLKKQLLVKLICHGIALGILIASIIHYINEGSPNIDWCQGIGFLWVLYFIFYVVYFYYGVEKLVAKPVIKIFRKIISFYEYSIFEELFNKGYFKGVLYAIPVILIAVYVIIFPGKSGRRIISFFGLMIFIAGGFLFSKYPGHVRWRTVLMGLFLQFLIGVLAINWEISRNVLDCISQKVQLFLSTSEVGAEFVYGNLSKPQKETGLIFAFSVLPVIFFLCFFVNILSYYGVLQWIIIRIARVVKMVMGTTVCESVNAAASIFLGMSEAPLLVKGYLKDLTQSELCSILCAGWSTVAGTVLAAYIKFGIKASHLISASLMSAPASLSLSKLFYPETEISRNSLDDLVLEKEEANNALDAACKGAQMAIQIVLSIIANTIALLSFISLIDDILNWIGLCIGYEELSNKMIMSKLFIPVSFLMGVETESLEDVAYLIGIKTVANEFQAYQKLGEWIKDNKLSKRSETLATYALCGFSNFGSIGISLGTLSAIEPSQRPSLTKVALRAFVAANLVCFTTACVAGCLIE